MVPLRSHTNGPSPSTSKRRGRFHRNDRPTEPGLLLPSLNSLPCAHGSQHKLIPVPKLPPYFSTNISQKAPPSLPSPPHPHSHNTPSPLGQRQHTLRKVSLLTEVKPLLTPISLLRLNSLLLLSPPDSPLSSIASLNSPPPFFPLLNV